GGAGARVSHEADPVDVVRAVIDLPDLSKGLSQLLVDQIQEFGSLPPQPQLSLHRFRGLPFRFGRWLRFPKHEECLETAAVLTRPVASESCPFVLPGGRRDRQVETDAVSAGGFVSGENLVGCGDLEIAGERESALHTHAVLASLGEDFYTQA